MGVCLTNTPSQSVGRHGDLSHTHMERLGHGVGLTHTHTHSLVFIISIKAGKSA